MPVRIIPFANQHFYHVFNRGVEKRYIFNGNKDQNRFLKTLNYYQFSGPKPKFSTFIRKDIPLKPQLDNKIVEIVAFCLMPNHFHLLLKQIKEGGISEFVSKVSNSYTRYYNTKHNRIGPLLQGQFKAVLVKSDEQLVHLSRYIHLNPLVSSIVKDLMDYDWSSYKHYIDLAQGFSSKQEVLSFFKSAEEYKQFVLDHADYALSLESIKHQLIDQDLT